MNDHYIACVVIIFAALLATIPTYHEMMSAQTRPGTAPAPEIVAGTFTDTYWTNSAPSGTVPYGFDAHLGWSQQSKRARTCIPSTVRITD